MNSVSGAPGPSLNGKASTSPGRREVQQSPRRGADEDDSRAGGLSTSFDDFRNSKPRAMGGLVRPAFAKGRL